MDKNRKKELLRQYKERGFTEARQKLGLTREQLKDLLDAVDEEVVANGCDHTPRGARSWLASHGFDVEQLIHNLGEFGGYCDCEVVMNVTPDRFGWPEA